MGYPAFRFFVIFIHNSTWERTERVRSESLESMEPDTVPRYVNSFARLRFPNMPHTDVPSGKDSVKRSVVGIWKCHSCRKVIAGGAYSLSTASAVTVRSTIARLRKIQQESV